jgi:outer membrane protein OmpA-like peptidoglycan-associated protein
LFAVGQPNDYPHYVVIGAFSKHSNAINFTRHAGDLKLTAKYEINPNRNLYYVYVLTTADRKQAVQEALRLRKETEFFDTWVYQGLLGQDVLATVKGQDINPETQQKIDAVVADDSQANTIVSTQLPAINTAAPSTTGLTANGESVVMPDADSAENKTASDVDEDLDSKGFVFKLYRDTDSTTVEGDVNVIDTEKLKKIGSYKANIPVRVSKPVGKSGQVSVVCEVFGYRKQQRDITYNNPEGEGIQTDDNGNTVVPFELVRLRKGDIAIMYNVYFFKDAGVMRPESRFEVNSLLEMLKENEKYKIKIHGHTNGNAAGKVISMGPGKNYFSLTDTKEGFGSAKKLSEERANVIKEYLVSEGINPHRMHVKAWGGKRAIHDKMSNRASENVRVEIEILEDK